MKSCVKLGFSPTLKSLDICKNLDSIASSAKMWETEAILVDNNESYGQELKFFTNYPRNSCLAQNIKYGISGL